MRKLSIRLKTVKAFTLNEMLMVLAIIGILLLIALPSFMPLIAKTKAQEAKIQLKHIANLQTQHRYINSQFTMEMTALNFEPPRSVKQGGTANYVYEITQANTTDFIARAEAIVDFDGDGVFNVWEIDQNGTPKEVIPD